MGIDSTFFRGKAPEGIRKPALEPKLPSNAAAIANACGDSDFTKYFASKETDQTKSTCWYA